MTISKFNISPISKNVVDSIIKFSNDYNILINFIPSRRQIDVSTGYVNNWTTKEFYEYIKSKSNLVKITRDHSGPNQGENKDDGYNSLKEDCKFMDTIHIDPWKEYTDFYDGLNETIKMINFCYKFFE